MNNDPLKLGIPSAIQFSDPVSYEKFACAVVDQKNPEGDFRPALVLSGPPCSGKTTLAKWLLSRLGVGDPCPLSVYSKAELAKCIPGAIKAGYLWLDDYSRAHLETPELIRVITADFWQYRKLGTSEVEKLPIDLVVVLSGCSVELSEMLARRSRVVNLDRLSGLANYEN